MYTIKDKLEQELKTIQDNGLFKKERVIVTPQDAVICLQDGSEVINFCANNYLGLSSHPRVIEAAKKAMDTNGFGMSSVRFICGTQDIHKELEAKIAAFLGTEDAILYAACFDANGGVFEPLFDENDAIPSMFGIRITLTPHNTLTTFIADTSSSNDLWYSSNESLVKRFGIRLL